MSTPVKVLVVDDHFVERSFFEQHVQMSTKYILAGSLPNAEQAIAWCAEHPVDLVIMDVMMKYGLDGLTCAKTIRNNHPAVRIILVTSMAESGWIGKARKAGIEGFWFKEYADVSLTEMMDRIIAGETVYPDMPPNPKFGESVKVDLSERELDVLRELTMNRTNEEIAQDLNLSPSTVKHHIEHMLEKTGYKNRIDLAVNAKSLAVVVHDEDRTGSSGRASGPQIPDEA